MTPVEYDFLRQFLKTRSGLVLSNEKQYLIESRLLPVARKNGLQSIGALVSKLRDARDGVLGEAVVEAMTTNESFFFRDKVPFDHLVQTILPDLLEKRASRRQIRIWCAAASTGQEPYSIAMCLKEFGARLAGWRIEIVGTDISNEVLERAKAGVYSQFEVQRGLPIQHLLKYFTQNGDTWTISHELRSMVQWKKFNLLESFAALGQFDVVFCRNVLIYFDQPTKSDILNRIAKTMPPDGYLMLGAAETVVGLTEAFKPVADRRGLYGPAAAPAEKAEPRRFAMLSGGVA
ncbi:CheR family methyltransferase [Oharaeibacter diazotrophicus]|uniref:Chemotaxis protein methyltransferase n=1 Tax=Oharaeibacter diazotrophicus TaxID=1920512 RepID=A0A4R6RAB1_9HYPH|nr:protein-glutamate O-methyltransferase CheR [Oharaeibacter diazotrophicus]TDP82577.1 chemotaxis protein methyltransferase CheR [Oharaeibacter diazotrophicus]BBE72659.1 chemotaxis protein methyltransferase Cher2 [Pleomorphomonas sp. SM30]GLS76693.1 chemotaxis protein methyltransferase [Oharaeibacter diazotrophicus]